MLYSETTTQEVAVPHKTNWVQITPTSLTCCHYRTSAIITTCKQSLGQGNIFTPILHPAHRACAHPSMQWVSVHIPACNGVGVHVSQHVMGQGCNKGVCVAMGFVTRVCDWGVCVTRGCTAPPQDSYPTMVNKWAVCILLECFLVSKSFWPLSSCSGPAPVMVRCHSYSS